MLAEAVALSDSVWLGRVDPAGAISHSHLVGESESVALGALPARRRADRLAGRVALALAYSKAVGGSMPHNVTYRPDGRPCLPEVTVSIAHSRGWGAAAIDLTGRHVGTDVEHLRPDLTELAGFMLAEDELAGYRTAPDRPLWLLRRWTAKEAALKALGLGLRRSPRRARVWLTPERASLVPGKVVVDDIVLTGWSAVEGSVAWSVFHTGPLQPSNEPIQPSTERSSPDRSAPER